MLHPEFIDVTFFVGVDNFFCGHSFTDCFSYEEADQCEAINGTFYLKQCYNRTYAELHNYTELAVHSLKRPPAEEYFE